MSRMRCSNWGGVDTPEEVMVQAYQGMAEQVWNHRVKTGTFRMMGDGECSRGRSMVVLKRETRAVEGGWDDVYAFDQLDIAILY